MNIFKKMQALTNLTSNEKVLVEYITTKPQEVILLKPKEIVDKTFVSLPTLYRFINKLGIHGIHDLKIEIVASIKENKEKEIENYNFPILPTDTHYEVMIHLKHVYEKTIEDTLDLANPDTLVKISQLMDTAKMIDVYTSAANLFFAENFQFQMQEIGVNVMVPKEEYAQRLTAANSDPSHLAIVISYGGRGMVVKELVNILKDNHVDIVLITSTQNNPLCKYAKYTIYMSSFENHFHKISSFSTRMTILYILDTLYSVYFKRNYERNIEKKISSYKKINAKLQ